MFWRLTEGSVRIPSGDLNYLSFGIGQRDLIIIQGLNVRDIRGAGASLALMYKQFAKDFRVWFFDRRLHVKEGLTNWDLAEDIYFAMKELQIESADVCGVSQGGMIALALTLEHPERVSQLVLAVTASRTNENIRRVVSRWVNRALNRDHAAINKDTFSLMYSDGYLRKYKPLIPILVRMLRPADYNRFAVLASAILTFDCYDRLHEIRCPVLVLGGEKDRITTGQASVEIAEKLNCEIHMYSEYGHAAYEEANDFNDRIVSFLRNRVHTRPQP